MKKTDHMQDPEFEKQVQKKMEELNFSPSVSVWKNVEKGIKKDRKRNRGLFLLFLCLGFALSGMVYILVSLEKQGNRESAVLPDKKPQTPDAIEKNRSANEKIESVKALTKPVVGNNEKLNPETEKNKMNPKDFQPARLNQAVSNIVGNKNPRNRVRAFVTKKERAIVISGNSAVYSQDKDFNQDKKMKPGAAAEGMVEGSLKKQNDTANISIEKMALLSFKNPGADSIKSTEKSITSAKKTDKGKKTASWRLGFTEGTGSSTIEQGLFQTGRVADPTSFSANPPGGGAGRGYYPSSFKPGISVSAGLFVKKFLNKKTSLSIGLNYHYYSTKIQTGSKVDSFLLISPNYGSPSGGVALAAYYRSGSAESFTNHYHYIELPAMLQLQLNQSRKTPLFLEAGAILSQFVNSDALHFNSASGVYYKDNSLFNKTQFSVSSSFLVGFNSPHALFQLGPMLQYHFTDLLGNNQGYKEHLFFGGFKFILVPQKK